MEKRAMEKVYDPTRVEGRLYAHWEESGYFKAEADPAKRPFTIVMPPPNITGQLHVGHAMDQVPQDTLTRYHRMKGESALFLPGTDHASIATEVKIVEALAEEGLTKEQIGREKFLERAWAWKDKYGTRIMEQIRRLGDSCDWSRERFTMDEGCSEAVVEVFLRLYDQGLIYRGERMINWCPVCKTALSDAEVEHEEITGKLYHVRYRGTEGAIVVATTRPETMLGDTAVAVHPEDARYAHLIGKTVVLPVVNKEIPIIADEYVDKEFGTGAVKITPAHDPNDFEVGLRHDLPVINVLNEDGSINENGGRFRGMGGKEARKAILAELEAMDALVKTEDLTHNVGHCYRCHQVVEPRISLQWFVKMKPLAEPAIAVVKEKKTKIIPERHEKVYLHWMENIRDWCISRQLWWGHRIPAYYCDGCGHMMVAREMPDICPICGSRHMRQDEDVLDTWFSSALWPFSTLGWPKKTPDLAYFYPTDVLVTAYDILFFWVARMIFSGIENMGATPFHTVMIHGLCRDAEGRKMSKSLGNGVDPLEIIDQYGADALRFSLVNGVAPGSDVRFSTEKVESARNFCNKIWNAARFVLMNAIELPDAAGLAFQPVDHWIRARFDQLARDVTHHLDEYDLGMALSKIYDFLWSAYCDWYIEMAKPRLSDPAAQYTLLKVLEGTLKLLHPFMPFITEELYSYLPQTEGTIMRAPWPVPDPEYPRRHQADAAEIEAVMEIVTAVRGIRADMNVKPSRKAKLQVLAPADKRAVFEHSRAIIERLAYASALEFVQSEPEDSVSVVLPAGSIFIPLGDLVDKEKEIERLRKEEERQKGEIARAEGKLNNPGFTGKAPAPVIEAERAKLQKARELLEQIAARRKAME